MRPGDRLTVTCASLDDEGAGVSAETPRLHVAGALPDERVVVTVEHVSPHAHAAGARGWARLETIERASPARVAPACPAFGACGGCPLQHLAYAGFGAEGGSASGVDQRVDQLVDQLSWKQSRVRAAFAAHPALAAAAIAPTVPSPRPLGYRSRSKLVPARAGARLVLGAYAPRSHAVVDTRGCRIAEPPLDETADALRALLERAGIVPYDERALTGDLRHVVLQSNRDGRVLTVWVARRSLPDGPALARAFREARPEVVGVVQHVNRARGNAIFDPAGETRVLEGDGTIEDRVDVGGQTLRLRLSAGAFFQVNRDVAGLAYAAVARGLALRASERLVDVYCGVGGMALALAPAAGEVLGIESHLGAIDDARASAALSGIGNARFVAGDAAHALAAVDRADVVVLNPPRKGCAPAVLAEVTRLAPRAVAYLSCDPDTLARDLAWLIAHGFAVRSVTPFDMMPHTPHIETLALLERGASSA